MTKKIEITENNNNISKLNLLPNDLLVLDDLILFYKKNYPTSYLSNDLDNELIKFKENINTISYSAILKKCFEQISIKDIFTTENTNINKVSLYSFSFYFLDPLYAKCFDEICDPNLIKNNKELFEKITIRLLNLNIYSNQKIKKIVNTYDFDDYQKNNDFLLKINNFKTMLNLCEVSKNFNPWIVITKEGNIETFWATHVATRDSFINKSPNNSTSFDKKITFFQDNLSKWDHISTKNTTNQDLKSRIFTFLLSTSSSKSYRKIQTAIKTLNLTKYNLNVEDYVSNIKDNNTLKEKFIKYGFFKLLDITNSAKKDKTASIEDFHNIINKNPKDIEYINTQKGFLKIYLHTLINNENLYYENALLKILNNSVKKIVTLGIQYSYECFFPIKNEYLNLSIDELKAKSKNNNKHYSSDNMFLDYAKDLTRSNFEKSFKNLLEYLCKQDNINWNTLVSKDQCNLFTSCLKVLSQGEHISFKNSKFTTSENIFLDIFKNKLTNNEKVKSLEFIVNNWQTDFLSGNQLFVYDTQYIRFKSDNTSIFVYSLQEMFTHIFEQQIELPKTFFNENLKSLLSTLNKYQHDSIEKLNITVNYLEQLQISSSDLVKESFSRKINKL